MAGMGSRFTAAGHGLPKPFIDIAGKMMIERVLDGLALEDTHYTLIIQEMFKHEYAEQLRRITGRYHVGFATVERLTQGACCTALAALEIFNNNLPVVFADCDNIFHEGVLHAFIEDARQRHLDGSLMTFHSASPQYSYAETDKDGFVVRTIEKEVIGKHAVAGAYMFRKGANFVRCAVETLMYGERDKGEYYMSAVYNRAVRHDMKIGVFDIADCDWDCVGTPEQVRVYMWTLMNEK
jgi:dTDP-glucose pyrophosphorylase